MTDHNIDIYHPLNKCDKGAERIMLVIRLANLSGLAFLSKHINNFSPLSNVSSKEIQFSIMYIYLFHIVSQCVPLYRHIADLAGNTDLILPVPALNVINGGSHAGNKLAMQEFMILPTG